jgi:hypothetical protein
VTLKAFLALALLLLYGCAESPSIAGQFATEEEALHATQIELEAITDG